ncbi:MAG TPA: hypothetical protein VGK92_01145, partial [Gaiellales bacterium]
MPVALPQPVVLATSVASYLVAPAAGKSVTAWLEFPAARANTPDAAARRHADRLVIANRGGRGAQVVYDGGCSATQVCDTVGAPLAGTDSILYGVADGRHADIASASLRRRPSRLVAQLAPAGGSAPPYTLAGPEAVWSAPAALRMRPPDLSAPAATLVSAPAGGTIRAIARREPVTAWIARAADGGDALYEQLDGGRASVLYRETRAGFRLTSLATLDGGRVALVARRTAAGATSATVLLVTPRIAEPSVLVASAPSPAALAYDPTVSAFGQGVAFRRRVGSERGLADQIVVVNTLTGKLRIVASARVRTARLSDPSLGFGR